MKSIFILTLLIILSLSVVVAIDPTYIYKTGEVIDFKHPCFNNGTYCSSSSRCNMTWVQTPTGDVFLDNVLLTNNGAYHNYTFASSTVDAGVYAISMICEDSGLLGAEAFYVQLTPSGQTGGQIGIQILMILLSYGVIIVGLVKRDVTITVLGTFALFFLGIWLLFNGIDIYKNSLTDGFAWVTLGVACYVSVRVGYEYIVG